MFSYIVAVFLSLSVTNLVVSAPHNGSTNDIGSEVESRIAYGTPAAISEFPFYAGLVDCGAAIISEMWVVTAAHCVEDKISSGLLWVGGSTFATSVRISYAQTFIHPGYDEQYLFNDIALLKLKQPLKFNDKIQPIQLPETPEQTTNNELLYTFVGRGGDETSVMGKYLQMSKMRIYSATECTYGLLYQYLMKVYGFIRNSDFDKRDESAICIIRADGDNGICPGDSGSPLIRGQVLIGLGSYSHQNEVICSQRDATAYVVNVASYVPWIKDVIALYS